MHSVEELLEAVKGYDTKEVYVIGGSSVYEQLLPYCDTAHVTKIDHAYEADAWFPNLDEDPDWEITADSDEQYYFDLILSISLNMSAKRAEHRRKAMAATTALAAAAAVDANDPAFGAVFLVS